MGKVWMDARGWKRRNLELYDCCFLSEVGRKVISGEWAVQDLMRMMKVYNGHLGVEKWLTREN